MYTRATAPNRSRWCAEQAALKGDPKSWEKPMATNLQRGGAKNFFLFKRRWSSTAHRRQVVRRTILLARNSLVSATNSLSSGSRQIALCIYSFCSRMCHFFWLRQVFCESVCVECTATPRHFLRGGKKMCLLCESCSTVHRLLLKICGISTFFFLFPTTAAFCASYKTLTQIQTLFRIPITKRNDSWGSN